MPVRELLFREEKGFLRVGAPARVHTRLAYELGL